MPLPVSGTLRRFQDARLNPMYQRPPYGVGDNATYIDPRHSEPGQTDDRPIYLADPYQPAATDGWHASDYVLSDVEPLVDQTPVDHQDGRPARRANLSNAELGALHSVDRGAPARFTEDPGTTKTQNAHLGDSWNTYYVEGLKAPPVTEGPGDVQLRRGLNAYPENNPPREMYGGEGWRRGVRIWHRDEHNLAQPLRRHRWRVIYPNVAATASNIPGATEPGPYGPAPWSSLARAIRRQNAKPQTRRTPAPLSEAMVTDGLDTAEGEPISSWVVR